MVASLKKTWESVNQQRDKRMTAVCQKDAQHRDSLYDTFFWKGLIPCSGSRRVLEAFVVYNGNLLSSCLRIEDSSGLA